MGWWEVVAILPAGAAAGMINTIVGSASKRYQTDGALMPSEGIEQRSGSRLRSSLHWPTAYVPRTWAGTPARTT